MVLGCIAIVWGGSVFDGLLPLYSRHITCYLFGFVWALLLLQITYIMFHCNFIWCYLCYSLVLFQLWLWSWYPLHITWWWLAFRYIACHIFCFNQVANPRHIICHLFLIWLVAYSSRDVSQRHSWWIFFHDLETYITEIYLFQCSFFSSIVVYEHYGSTRYFFNEIFFQSDIFKNDILPTNCDKFTHKPDDNQPLKWVSTTIPKYFLDKTFTLQNFTHQTSPSNIILQIFFHVLENFITQQTKQHSNNNQPLKWILQLYNLSWVKETFCKCSFTKHQPAQPPNYHTSNQATH